MNFTCDFTAIDADFDMLDYSYADYSQRGSSIAVRGEKRLWCAIIHQAFIDMLPFIVPGKRSIRSSANVKKPSGEGPGKIAQAALKWLLYNRRDFNFVCQQAGVSPAIIREAAMKMAIRHSLI